MGNHYHLLLETASGNLSDAMRQLNGVYAQRFNRRHDRSGHLFEGRFRSPLVDTEPYLLEVIRYIVLNPVRAGAAARPEDWLWSSHRATAGLSEVGGFIAVDEVLSFFDDDLVQARNAYRRFIEEGIDGQTVPVVTAPVVGSPGFVRALEPRLLAHQRDQELALRERYMARPPLEHLFDRAVSTEARSKAIRAARYRYGYRLREIASHLGVHYATVSRGQVLK